MKVEEIKKLLAILGLVLIAGCGGSNTVPDTMSDGTASLSVSVSNSKNLGVNSRHAKIEHYLVTVAGGQLQEPVQAEFPGDATEGVINDLPPGEGYSVSVAAINPDDATIRMGEDSGIEVNGMTEVKIALESVPIFTNLKDESVIENTRLILRVFSEPGHQVIITDSAEGALVDAAANTSEIALDESTGLGLMAPRLLAPGEHEFLLTDLTTGRSSKARVKLLDGSKRRPAPFVAAGATNAGAVVQAGLIAR